MAETPLLSLKLDSQGEETRSGQTLSAGIYAALRERIVSGQLLPASRLPPSRKLAEELGVSRGTVVIAYEQLMAEGFAEGRTGSGVYVSQIGEVENIAANPGGPAGEHQAFSQTDHPRPFLPGQLDTRLFPYRDWARCVARVSRMSPQALINTDDAFGDTLLREQIRRYLYDWRGLSTSAAQILITAGAMEGLELCAKTLIHDKGSLWLENPGYPPLRNFADSMKIPIHWLERDAQGSLPPVVDEGAESPNLAVLTPSSQFPLGGAMPLARRNAFISWAATSDAWIIEDDYDSEFRYAGRPIPALAGLDQQQRTIYVGSFAKVFSNGLRLGFLVIPNDLVEPFRETLKRFGSKASAMPQRPLALFMQGGEYYRHIRRVRRIYSERRAQFIELLRTHLGNWVEFDDHKAGMHITVRLPEHLPDHFIAKEAAKMGVTCVPLSGYYAGEEGGNGLVLGFCAYTPEEMESAMIGLGQAMDAAGAEGPSDSIVA